MACLNLHEAQKVSKLPFLREIYFGILRVLDKRVGLAIEVLVRHCNNLFYEKCFSKEMGLMPTPWKKFQFSL